MTTPGEGPPGPRTQQRLRSLVVANRAIVAELSLDSLLRLVVESARTVVEAEYAVLEVVRADGLREQLIHSGSDACAGTPRVEAGTSLSQLVPGSPLPIRLQFPEDRPGTAPALRSLLGVPLASGGLVRGTLFLADRAGGAAFTAEDESLVTALAATATIAIENARLHAESRRRQEWLLASSDISRRLMCDEGPADAVLVDVAETVRRLAPAEMVGVVVPDPATPGTLVVVTACGPGSDQLLGLRYPREGSVVWQAMVSGRGVLVGEAARGQGPRQGVDPPIEATDVMALPLKGTQASKGAIVVIRTSPDAFTEADLDLAGGFAGQATLALELAESRRERQQLAVLEDRSRIARDLHDHVVQKLFAVALSLHGAAVAEEAPAVGTRLASTVTHLDETIRSIRTSIVELQAPRSPRASFRARVMAALNEIVPVLGFTPRLHVDGPLDAIVDEAVTGEVVVVLREALANVALHAEATSVVVHLHTDEQRLTVSVRDDGAGLPPDFTESGLAALRQQAERRGGTLDLAPAAGGGLELSWTIPV